jgi:UDP-N-acetylglucosamine/UDP-N-acetylgalactosamine diphosphorylase
MRESQSRPNLENPGRSQPDVVVLRDHLARFDQAHVLQFWDQLDPLKQQALALQVEQLDLGLIQALYRNASGDSPAKGGPDWELLARRAEPPHAVRMADWRAGIGSSLGMTSTEARQRGIEALRAGKVGVLLVAGGQGTRLDFELPKSLYPIGPISQATLLQIHVEKVRAASHRYGVPIPVYLMTSPATHEATVRFLQEHDRLGLAESQLFVFCQGSMPAVDARTGRLLMSDVGEVFMSPDGHGGTVVALAASGATEQMRKLGIEELFYLQVDNPLAPIADPELIGAHLLASSEMTSLAIAKSGPYERLGNFMMLDGRLQIIEYSDFPSDVAERRDDLGELVFWAGSVAIHVFQVEFLRRSLSRTDSLPFHIAHKKVSHVDACGGWVTPEEANALKFERFIFDLLPQAERPIVVEYAEQESFAPLKNAPGAEKDTPEYVRRMLLAQHGRWLKAAGAIVGENVDVEISPLFALDAQGVAERIEPGRQFEQSVYLCEQHASGS